MLYIHFPPWLHPEVIPGLRFPRWYSLMYIVAFIVCHTLMRRRIVKDSLDIDNDTFSSYFFWILMGLLVGIRFFYVFFYTNEALYYLTHPWMIFSPFDGQGNFVGFSGLSFHGGLIGVITAMILFCRVKKQPFFLWADVTTAAVPLGYFFGRIGNFINGELYGRATTHPFGIVFPQAAEIPGNADLFRSSIPWVREMATKVGMKIDGEFINLPRHPSQLYEAIFEGIVLWAILWLFIYPRQKFKGVVSGFFLIGYGFFRFVIEYCRQPDPQLGYVIQTVPGDYRLFTSFLNFSMGQVLCFLMILGGVFVILLARYIDRMEAKISAVKVKTPPMMSRSQRRNKRNKIKKHG